MDAWPARRLPACSPSEASTRARACTTLAAIGLLCWSIMCAAQMVGPTPQAPGVLITPEQAEQVQPENWAIHGQSLSPQLRSQGGDRTPSVRLHRHDEQNRLSSR